MLEDRAGNIAMIWGLTGAALIGMVGLGVDFTRAQAFRLQMQTAADGAVLAAQRAQERSFADRDRIAREHFFANLAGNADPSQITFTLSEIDEGHRVDARAPSPLTLARVISMGQEYFQVAVSSEAASGALEPLEIALVLDNTGSMSAHMGALREGAGNLARDLFALATDDELRMAVVPYVTTVNVGNGAEQMSWMDVNGLAALHGEMMENRPAGTVENCGAPNEGTGGSIAGRSPAYGLVRSGCNWNNPSEINHFRLFDAIPNVTWKGCVETRPRPHDVSDTAPNAADPSTLFVPYFWMDDGASAGGTNSYLTEYALVDGARISNSNNSTTRAQRTFTVTKYDGRNANVDETPPDTRGPNRSCPTPVLPLTNDAASVAASIQGMSHWFNGGTNIPEGLAWGWRTLSPGAPFTQGAPYGDSHKIVVLMSDGRNEVVTNGANTTLLSDYFGTQYLGLWQNSQYRDDVFPEDIRVNGINGVSSYTSYVNTRMQQVCANVKAEGIEVYTVLFRETETNIVNIMRDCASSPSHAFRANTSQDLVAVFDSIADAIADLRLTR